MRPIKRELIGDLLARTVVGAFFVLLSFNILNDFVHTGRLTGLLLLASEALVVVFTIVRRPARQVDRSPLVAAVATFAVLTPAFLRATERISSVPESITVFISVIALCLIVTGKLAIGRSFGIVPANRGVVVRGPYTVVRHPIYAGYLLNYLGFLLAYPTVWNSVVVTAAGMALVLRAIYEERVLSEDVDYQAYCHRVGWHLVPGVF